VSTEALSLFIFEKTKRVGEIDIKILCPRVPPTFGYASYLHKTGGGYVQAIN